MSHDNHKHAHCAHTHLAHCQVCQLVYCHDCNQEWSPRLTWAYNTLTYPPQPYGHGYGAPGLGLKSLENPKPHTHG